MKYNYLPRYIEYRHRHTYITHMLHGTGILTYNWLKCMVNVGKNSIHGASGIIDVDNKCASIIKYLYIYLHVDMSPRLRALKSVGWVFAYLVFCLGKSSL